MVALAHPKNSFDSGSFKEAASFKELKLFWKTFGKTSFLISMELMKDVECLQCAPVYLTYLFDFGNLSLIIVRTITSEYYYICWLEEEKNTRTTGLLGFLVHYYVALPSKDVDQSDYLDTKRGFLGACVRKLLPCFHERAKMALLAWQASCYLCQRGKARQISLDWKPRRPYIAALSAHSSTRLSLSLPLLPNPIRQVAKRWRRSMPFANIRLSRVDRHPGKYKICAQTGKRTYNT